MAGHIGRLCPTFPTALGESRMPFDWSRTRIHCPVDLESPGRRCGHLLLPWSDNSNPLGGHPVPILVAAGAPGPTLLLTAGVHGDEFEGPVALLDLWRGVDPAGLRGRIVVLPALNAPAVRAASRTSPLDGANLNRAFPGDPDGGPTAQIAHMVEAVLMPGCDAAVDLHSGGKASWFHPCALPARAADGTIDAANMALARAFGAPAIWLLGSGNDARSLNGAATRTGVPMIAAELGGGGGIDPALVALAGRGLRRIMAHLGMIDNGPEAENADAGVWETADPALRITAPLDGLVEPLATAGERVAAGQPVARWLSLAEPDRAPLILTAPRDALVLATGRRGLVAQGEIACQLASAVDGAQDR